MAQLYRQAWEGSRKNEGVAWFKETLAKEAAKMEQIYFYGWLFIALVLNAVDGLSDWLNRRTSHRG